MRYDIRSEMHGNQCVALDDKRISEALFHPRAEAGEPSRLGMPTSTTCDGPGMSARDRAGISVLIWAASNSHAEIVDLV